MRQAHVRVLPHEREFKVLPAAKPGEALCGAPENLWTMPRAIFRGIAEKPLANIEACPECAALAA